MLEGAKFFSVADACQAYHQLPLADERSKDLTSFITPDGSTYRYKYCSFGLVNAPAAWSRLIDTCLSSLRWDVVLVYMDNCLMWTKTSNPLDHIADLDKVFDALDSYGIEMKASKCMLSFYYAMGTCMRLQEFTFEVKHRPGKHNSNADGPWHLAPL